MEPRFHVYVTGNTLEGFRRQEVIEALARLFVIEQAAAEALLNGVKRRVKTDCDKATALKYREALEQIGAAVDVERNGNHTDSVQVLANQPSIGADEGRHQSDQTIDQATQPIAPGSGYAADGIDTPWELAPPGTFMLEPHAATTVPSIVIPAYDVAEPGELIPNLITTHNPVIPDTSHLLLRPIDE